ncbi:MAG TPA: amidase [Pyrinomonadaceae bacterium]|nr:amidase [Pyrinomonadaceae bacterium]
MDDLTSFSAARLAALTRRREVSPVEVVEAYLERIARLNPHLNAIVTLAPDALERARAVESVQERGALYGVPLTVKDTIETRGLRTTYGMRMRADFVPDRDAAAVARLRAAGALIIGKTNPSESALDYTADNPVFGRTNHPHDARLTPGGSSGGCASAVAAHLAAASLGSDLVGSIRIPAHFCGVAGLKATAGRIPGAGHFPPVEGAFALGASLGPIARRVADLSLLFDVLTGSHQTASHEDEAHERAAQNLRGRRVAWYADDGTTPVSHEMRRAVERAARALAEAGLDVSERHPPHVNRGGEVWTKLFAYPTQRLVRAAYAGREAEAGQVARLLLERAARAASPSLDEYFDAWAERDRLRAELLAWMEDTPLLVAPVGAVAAYAHDTRAVEVGGATLSTFRAFAHAQAFNAFDLPAVCVPVGRTREGLPVGVQLVGRPFEEREVLSAALIVEAACGGDDAALHETPSNDDANPL